MYFGIFLSSNIVGYLFSNFLGIRIYSGIYFRSSICVQIPPAPQDYSVPACGLGGRPALHVQGGNHVCHSPPHVR